MGKDVFVEQQDISQKIKKVICRSDKSNIDDSSLKTEGKDTKVLQPNKIWEGTKPILKSDNGNNDVPSQDDAVGSSKDVEIENVNKV